MRNPKKTCPIDNRFRRVCYEPVPQHDAEFFHVVVQYVGDESVVVQNHHGNRKTPAPDGIANYVRTAPETIGRLLSSNETPISVYHALVAESNNIAIAPRDPEQVRNAQRRARAGQRISKDAIWNSIAISSDLAEPGHSEFIRRFTIRPSVQVVLADDFALSECRKILKECDRISKDTHTSHPIFRTILLFLSINLHAMAPYEC